MMLFAVGLKRSSDSQIEGEDESKWIPIGAMGNALSIMPNAPHPSKNTTGIGSGRLVSILVECTTKPSSIPIGASNVY